MVAAKQLSELPKEVLWRVLGFVDESHRAHYAAVDRRWSNFGGSRGNSATMARGLRARGSIPNELLVGLVLQFLDDPDEGWVLLFVADERAWVLCRCIYRFHVGAVDDCNKIRGLGSFLSSAALYRLTDLGWATHGPAAERSEAIKAWQYAGRARERRMSPLSVSARRGFIACEHGAVVDVCRDTAVALFLLLLVSYSLSYPVIESTAVLL